MKKLNEMDLDTLHLTLIQRIGNVKKQLNENYTQAQLKRLVTNELDGFNKQDITNIYNVLSEIEVYQSCNSFCVLQVIHELI